MASRTASKNPPAPKTGKKPLLIEAEKTPTDETNKDIYVSTFDAAEMLGVSVGTVQKMVENNVLFAWKTGGGHRRISQFSIDAYRRQLFSNPDPWATATRGNLRVLFLDNDADSLQTARAAMQCSAKSVASLFLTTGLEAIMQMMAQPPDVLFCDLNLSDLDGMELLRKMENTPATSRTHLVALTTLDDTTLAARGGLPSKTVILRKPLQKVWLEGFLTALQLRHRL